MGSEKVCAEYGLHLDLLKDETGVLSAAKLKPIRDLVGADASFVETGTYLGDTAAAMRTIFKQVISVELSEDLYRAAESRFKGDKGVILVHGDSAQCIGDALRHVDSAAPVIWLDAHWSGGNTTKSDGNTPVLAELAGIKSMGLRDAVILIDDISYFWRVRPGFRTHDSIGGYPDVNVLIDRLIELNDEYVIVLDADILLAIPAQMMRSMKISPVLAATSRLRMGGDQSSDLHLLESTVASATGHERKVILTLPEIFSNALQYGIGGHFCYWRGLLHEREGRREFAEADFSLARSCGVPVAARGWEL